MTFFHGHKCIVSVSPKDCLASARGWGWEWQMGIELEMEMEMELGMGPVGSGLCLANVLLTIIMLFAFFSIHISYVLLSIIK